MDRLRVFSEKLGMPMEISSGMVGEAILDTSSRTLMAWSDGGWSNYSDSWLDGGWNNYSDGWMDKGWNNYSSGWADKGWNNYSSSWADKGWNNYSGGK